MEERNKKGLSVNDCNAKPTTDWSLSYYLYAGIIKLNFQVSM